MANTYAEIKTVISYEGNKEFGFQPYTTSMRLSLTAFMGGEHHTQITIQTDSTSEGQSGTAYYTLNDEQCDLLIGALLERKLKKISATSNEESIFCPIQED